jgi:uncharacterized protein (DUF1800 family)
MSPSRQAANDPELIFLVKRITQGFTLEELELARALGYEGYLEYHLDHLAIDDSALEARLEALPTLNLSPKVLYDQYLLTNQGATVVRELRSAVVLRSIFSRRQLFERMVELWSDHFSIEVTDSECRVLKGSDDRDVIREHALGSFTALLHASAKSAAMLFHLDNHTNTKVAPQENYARELMELHTLGSDGHTEVDVKEVARALTGWTRMAPSFPNYGEFKFRQVEHDTGRKQFLGGRLQTNGDIDDGERVLDILAAHPRTAARIARKMTSWLLVDDPPQWLVDRVASVYLVTGGDIQSMIREILDLQHVHLVDPWSQPKFVRPSRLVVSALRALGLEVSHATGILYELESLGHLPFGWPTPDGYPDRIEAWGSNLLSRWRFATRLFDAKISGIPMAEQPVMDALSATGEPEIVDAIDVLLTGGTMASEDKARLHDFLAITPLPGWTEVRETLALALSAPSSQFY